MTTTSLHCDRDLLRYERGIVWNVDMIPKHQLDGVLTRPEFQSGFGLALAEMEVLFVHRERKLQIWELSLIHI